MVGLGRRGFIFTLLSLVVVLILTTLFTLFWSVNGEISETRLDEVRLVKMRTNIDDFAQTYRDILNVSNLFLQQTDSVHKSITFDSNLTLRSRGTPLSNLATLYSSGYVQSTSGFEFNITGSLSSRMVVRPKGYAIWPQTNEFQAGGNGTIARIQLNLTVDEEWNSSNDGFSNDGSGTTLDISLIDNTSTKYVFSYVLNGSEANEQLEILFDRDASKELNFTYGDGVLGNSTLRVMESEDIGVIITDFVMEFASLEGERVFVNTYQNTSVNLGKVKYVGGVQLARS